MTTSLAAVEDTIVVCPVWAAVPIANVAAAVAVLNEPVNTVLPVAFPRFRAPVPPVLIVVTPAPEVLRLIVPFAVIEARVIVPVTAKVPPIVAFPVTAAFPPTARSVPAVMVVVDAIDPGAMKAAGIEKVIVAPAPAVVIWLAVPKKLKLFATGVSAPPESAVTVFTAEED
jgi:hypothetical protein